MLKKQRIMNNYQPFRHSRWILTLNFYFREMLQVPRQSQLGIRELRKIVMPITVNNDHDKYKMHYFEDAMYTTIYTSF